MPKHQKAKTARGGRNPDRPNGKAWSRTHGPAIGHPGHNLTGCIKPSGHSIGGHAHSTINRKNSGTEQWHARLDQIVRSRDPQHRKQLRRERTSAARPAR